MHTTRIALVLVGFILFLIGFGLLIRSPWLESRWLWPNGAWESFFFMASAFFAISFGYFIIAIQRKLGPLRNLAIAGIVSFGGTALYLLQASVEANGNDQSRLENWGQIFLIFAIINVLFLMASQNREIITTERIPVSLKWILGLIVVANLWVGLRLLGGIEAFAWQLTHEMAITYGWLLTGGAILAFLTCLEPFWENQWVLFAAFIGYDLPLIGPLVYLFFNPRGENIVLYRTAVYFLLVIVTLAAVVFYSLYYWKKSKKASPS